MKAMILGANWIKEVPNKWNNGVSHIHKITWVEGETTNEGTYFCPKKDQTDLVPNKEAEFTVEKVEKGGNTYYNIKLPKKGRDSNYGRNLKKEQSRYTTMGASYVKDLIIAGKIDIKDWKRATDDIVKFMFELDKEIES